MNQTLVKLAPFSPVIMPQVLEDFMRIVEVALVEKREVLKVTMIIFVGRTFLSALRSFHLLSPEIRRIKLLEFHVHTFARDVSFGPLDKIHFLQREVKCLLEQIGEFH